MPPYCDNILNTHTHTFMYAHMCVYESFFSHFFAFNNVYTWMMVLLTYVTLLSPPIPPFPLPLSLSATLLNYTYRLFIRCYFFTLILDFGFYISNSFVQMCTETCGLIFSPRPQSLPNSDTIACYIFLSILFALPYSVTVL